VRHGPELFQRGAGNPWHAIPEKMENGEVADFFLILVETVTKVIRLLFVEL
jgi:hypothetical protein